MSINIATAFTGKNVLEATKALLVQLNVTVHTKTTSPVPRSTLSPVSNKAVDAALAKVSELYYVGYVGEESFGGNFAKLPTDYKGMMVFAADADVAAQFGRGDVSALARALSRLSKCAPVLLVVREGDTFSLAVAERIPYVRASMRGEKAGRVVMLRRISVSSPHRGHIDIFQRIAAHGTTTYEDFYRHLLDNVLSVSVLTKQFYREIQNWYFWALKKDNCVRFPNDLADDSDDEKYNAENMIRLITRLMFTWFMKEKGLVNPDLFDTAFLSKALKHFAVGRDGPIEPQFCTYYRAILQNLFFATFNQEIPMRGFVESAVRDAKRYNVKNYYRNARFFTEKDEKKIIAYFNGSPFVNGGLFECLDNVEQNGKTYSWDGFSNNDHYGKKGSHPREWDGSLKTAQIPDRLFFGAETTVDLSEFLGGASATVKVRGIINILKDYVFTIEENTPLDEDVALDPELLGKVFENLLGCYNEETKQMARNATGSFYTPREIVNYMVKVTLKSYLKRALVGRVVPNAPFAAEIDSLVDGTAELADLPLVKKHAKDILTALFKAKILDPACGSGAFPMGIMSAMVEILRTVDPDNKHWYEIVLKESLDEAAAVADVTDEQERAELKAQIEYDFKERVDHPDYTRKLYIIEHCIFGSDIQPIAVQISSLRFFITLLCEQTKNDDPAKNYGITPLPNLESNFVAANSLISIDLKDMRELLKQKKILSLIRELRGVRHQLFLPKTSDKKRQLQEKDRKLREDIAAAAEGLYDENIEQKCEMRKAEIKRYEEQLAKLDKDDFKDVVKEVEEVDLFGEKTVTKKKVVGKGNVLLEKKKDAENALASLKNASRKERLLADVKRLVAWNPFAFNVAESFLDPEWMFGVKDGFDIVIGNPPYVKLETIKEQSFLYEDVGYEVYSRRSDLYCLFTERGFRLLSDGGGISYIMSNKWLQAEYGRPLRELFLRRNLQTLIDFGDNEIFKGATVYPCIFLAQNAEPEKIIDCVSMKNYTPSSFVEDMAKWKSTMPVSKLSGDTWILSTESAEILERLRASCVTLGEFIGGEAYYGIKPGATKAFIIDSATRNQIIAKDPKSAEIMHPMVRGRDVSSYFARAGEFYLIGTHNGYGSTPAISLSRYPGVCKWLSRFQKQLEARSDQGTTPFHLRDCAYWPVFQKPKIMYQKFQVSPCFIYDESGLYCNDSMWIMPTDNKALVGILNSKMGWWLISRFCTQIQNGYQLIWQYFKQIPIPRATAAQQAEIAILVDRVLVAKKKDSNADTPALESEIDQLVYKLYGLTDDEIAIVEGREKDDGGRGATALSDDRGKMRFSRWDRSSAVVAAEPTDDEVLE